MNSLTTIVTQIKNENFALISLQAQQLLFSAVIVVVGFIAISVLFRVVEKRLLAGEIRGGAEASSWNMARHTVPLRLICYAAVLRLAELPIQLHPLQVEFIHFLESLLIAIAILIFLLSLLNRAGSYISEPFAHLQDASAVRHLSTIKRLTRIFIVIVVLAGFVLAERPLFDSWLLSSGWWRYLLAFSLIVLFWVLSMSLSNLLLRISAVLGNRQEHARLKLILSSLLWPTRILVLALIVYSLKSVFTFPEHIIGLIGQSLTALSVLAVFLLIYNLLDILDHEMFQLVKREDNLLNQTFAQMVKLILRLIVITVGAIYLIQTLSGKPVSALLAGLGIGALAVALAAQDTLKNLFGSVMIMVDKPFDIGQRILVDGHDGVVEDIGFRSTRVRTLTGHQVTIPNERMASQSVENVGRRPHIRRLTDIGITYDTPPEKVEKALQLVKEIIADHEGMDPEFPPRVYFDEFKDYSLNLKMIYWFHPGDYWAFMDMTQAINLKIMKAFEAEGIEFAFPTSTTYLAQDERRRLSIDISPDKAKNREENDS